MNSRSTFDVCSCVRMCHVEVGDYRAWRYAADVLQKFDVFQFLNAISVCPFVLQLTEAALTRKIMCPRSPSPFPPSSLPCVILEHDTG